MSPHIPRSRGVGKGCPPKSPSLLHQEGLSREPKGSQHPGAQREAAWDHCWPLRCRKPAQALDATEISTPLSSCPFPALGCPVCPLSSHLPFLPLPHLQLSWAPTALLPSSSSSSPALLFPSVPKRFSLPRARIAFPAPPSTCLQTQTLSRGALHPT